MHTSDDLKKARASNSTHNELCVLLLALALKALAFEYIDSDLGFAVTAIYREIDRGCIRGDPYDFLVAATARTDEEAILHA